MKKRILITVMLFASLSFQTVKPAKQKKSMLETAVEKSDALVTLLVTVFKLVPPPEALVKPVKVIKRVLKACAPVVINSLRLYIDYLKSAKLTANQLDAKGEDFLPKKTSELIQSLKNIKGQTIDMEITSVLLFQITDIVDAFIAKIFETDKNKGAHYYIRKLAEDIMIIFLTATHKNKYGDQAEAVSKKKVEKMLMNAEKLYKVLRAVLKASKEEMLPKIDKASTPPQGEESKAGASFDDLPEENLDDWL